MFEQWLICISCGKQHPLNPPRFRCACGGSLDIVRNCRKLRKVSFEGRPFSHARYMEFFPVRSLVSLGEGGTPILRSSSIEKTLHCKLHFKSESINPTGSFKDRGSAVEVAKALELGCKKVVCASTGNMGASVAAYSARAGLDCAVIVPGDARRVKLQHILAYGSSVYCLRGTYAQAAMLAEESTGRFLLGDYLYRREGTKSVGFELAEQGKWDYVAVPVGNGTLLSAVWKAFTEFKAAGKLRRLPKIIAVQASGCSPIVRAFNSASALTQAKRPKTIAVAIECGAPLDGEKALRSLRESNGIAVTVTDKELLRARTLLATKEGIFAEPAGAAALAGIFRAHIPPGSRVACLVTGHGMKTPFISNKGKLIYLKKHPQ